MDAVSQGIKQVESLRDRVVRQSGNRAWTMAVIRNRGRTPVSIGGIPVGPLPAAPSPEQPLPAFNLYERLVPALGPRAVAVLPEAAFNAADVVPAGPPLRVKFVALPSLLDENDWVWLGPNRVGGRVRSILIHPTNPEVMWTGGISGGVFRSEDGGKTWASSYRLMGSLVVSCMSLHPWNPDTLFAGTGEGFYNVDAFRGAGIFRSDNGGGTWSQLASTRREEFRFVNRIAMTRSSPGKTFMLVAARSGLFRSEDDGTSFTQVSVPMDPQQSPDYKSEILDVHYHPNDPMRCVASGRGGNAFYSLDGGKQWIASTGIPVQPGFNGRVELAYAAASPKDLSKPTVVYASVDWCDGQVFRSIDGGKRYMLRANLKHMKYPDPDPTPGQGWYDNSLWAGDPHNANVLVVGGITLYRSIDGGRNFVPISTSDPPPGSQHTDQHIIVSVPGYDGDRNKAVYVGNDGGIYRTDDITTVTPTKGWKPMNNGLAITQFYGAGVQPHTGQIVGGAQDNDTRLYTPGPGGAPAVENWKIISGGDGGFSSADPEKSIFFGEYVTLQLMRYTAGDKEAEPIYDGITDAGNDETALFIAPAVLDPNRPGAMAAGGAQIWYAPNVRTGKPTWRAVKDPVTFLDPFDRQTTRYLKVSSITLVQDQPKTVWAGHEYNELNKAQSGMLFRCDDFDAAKPNWTQIKDATLPRRHSTRIVVDPADSKHVFALFGGYAPDNLWHTNNGGKNWENIPIKSDEGMLSVPMYDLSFHPDDPRVLILATELGLFVSGNSGKDWSPTSGGPTNCAVFQLLWHGRNLVAVTHGRGIFQIAVGSSPSPPPAPPGDAGIAP